MKPWIEKLEVCKPVGEMQSGDYFRSPDYTGVYKVVGPSPGMKNYRDCVNENGEIFNMHRLDTMFLCESFKGEPVTEDVEIPVSEIGEDSAATAEDYRDNTGLNRCRF